MATVEECQAALEQLAVQLAGVDADVRAKHTLDRTFSCHVFDLDVTFSAQLVDGTLEDVRRAEDPELPDEAQIKLSVSSDNLLRLCSGDLSLASAWARGKLRVDASMLDLLKIRTLL